MTTLDTRLRSAQPCFWHNPGYHPDAAADDHIGIRQAAERLTRFAPCIRVLFPDTGDGIIESPLSRADDFAAALERDWGMPITGTLWLKRDNELPISGSIKARGGIHEVLKYAEELALNAGLLYLEQDYRRLLDEEVRALFARHTLAVGSTGNLGLSIGTMAARLGFQVDVHMSADARQWKKDRLRQLGVRVHEYEDDYSRAVAEGRRLAEQDPDCHFVDDEHSVDLFTGYGVAGRRLKAQLAAQGIMPSAEHPLMVYLPCGVGGGPGGVAYGLKQEFGPHVHCFFVEPVQSPCVLLGMMTGKGAEISVEDMGLSNRTAADGLAVGRPSALVCRLMQPLLAGAMTVEDPQLFRLLALLQDSEGIQAEPSAMAGAGGLQLLLQQPQWQSRAARAHHLLWLTGGSMVPAEEYQAYCHQGQA